MWGKILRYVLPPPDVPWRAFPLRHLKCGRTRRAIGKREPNGTILLSGESRVKLAGSTWPRAGKFLSKAASEPAATMIRAATNVTSLRLSRSGSDSWVVAVEHGLLPKRIPEHPTRWVSVARRRRTTIFHFRMNRTVRLLACRFSRRQYFSAFLQKRH